MNLHDLYTRMNVAQLLLALLSIAALVLFVIVLLRLAFTRLFKKKPASFKQERNRFKADIAREQGNREFADAVKSVLLVLAVAIILIAIGHGK